MIHKTLLYFVVIIFGVTVQSMSLTIEKVIEKGLKNSHLLKEAYHLTESEKFTKRKSISTFMPTIDSLYSYSNSNRKLTTYTKETSSAGFQLTWNLFNGFSDYNSYQAASRSYSAKVYEENSLIEDIKLLIIKACIDVLSSEKALAVSKQSVKLLKFQLKTAEVSFKAGLIPKMDVLKVEAEKASERRKLLQAKSNMRIARANLEKVTGSEFHKDDRLEDFEYIRQEAPFYKDLESAMLRNRSEIKYLEKIIESRLFSEKSAKGSWLPSLDLTAGWTSYGDTEKPDGRKYNYNEDTLVQVSLKWTLFDGGARKNNYKIAKSETSRLKEKKNETEFALKTNLKTVMEEYLLACESYEITRVEVTSAKENYRVTEDLFMVNTVTATDLLDARTILFRAENSKNEARYNIFRSMADIERAVEKKVFNYGRRGTFIND